MLPHHGLKHTLHVSVSDFLSSYCTIDLPMKKSIHFIESVFQFFTTFVGKKFKLLYSVTF